MLEKQGLLSTHHRFDAEYSNIRRRCSTPVCQTRVRVSKDLSNPNQGSGRRLFEIPFTAKATEDNIAEFIFNEIYMHFGAPQEIFSDGGKNLLEHKGAVELFMLMTDLS